MALCAAGARTARGAILFFTESHVVPEADTLALAADTLAAHPEWAGFASRRLLFLHIRKTGGVSVRNLLENRFADADHVFEAHSRQRPADDPPDETFVTGHVHFGYLSRYRDAPIVFTILRDPVERALSAFHFFRANGADLFREVEPVLSPGELAERNRFTERSKRLSLAEFVVVEPELARRHLSNIQTLARLHSRPAGPPGPAELAEAKANLAACDLIGLLERMPETLMLLEHEMGWEGLGPLAHSETLPPAEHFRCDQPIHGWGWHVRERAGNDWICWTGLGDYAWLDLRLTTTDLSILECRLHEAIDRAAVDTLEITVNGLRVPHTRQCRGRGFQLAARIPRETLALQPGFVRIGFRVQGMRRPSAIDPAIRDDRRLGIALHEIRLRPA